MTEKVQTVFPGLPVEDVSEKYSAYECFDAISRVESDLKRGRAKLEDIKDVEEHAAKLQEHAAFLCSLIRAHAFDAELEAKELHDDPSDELVDGLKGCANKNDETNSASEDFAEKAVPVPKGFLTRVNDVCRHLIRN